MRRAVITSSATVAGVILLLSLKPHDTATGGGVISSGGSAAPAPAATSAPAASAPSAPAPSAPSAQATTGASRSVTGDAANTRYGAVQVKVTLDGSRISKIDVIRYPNRDRRDQEINGFALPQLNQEAITAQSAHIDVVSGATYTSDGYTRSLQSALDQAGL
ncbi:FMN-binding protein [Kitasatospora sp. NBC_00240]|uniref:FMN-binding protein n=1 Tax=Kitasatospora sp. NBC_00240 TaxID=2903567 RepID=UPI002254E009|nr:FMN-binding protein [Kitasatospora sp. NBC_00240]MCX5208229.1 FMN-binding protein [Kitasatospora sp. NBC_00240]